jgi:hypothetical protein
MMLAAEIVAVVIAAIIAARAIASAMPTRRPRAHEARMPPADPAGLEACRRAIVTAATAGDLHLRLRPILREVAEERLDARGSDAEAAEAALGEPLWELVRPDRPPPRESFATGVSPQEVSALLDRLEAT